MNFDEGVLTHALLHREELFETLENVLGTQQRMRLFMEIKPQKSQTEIAEIIGISQPAVSKALNRLLELGLVEKTEDGYKKTFSYLDHPLMEHLWRTEVLKSGEKNE